MTAVASSNPSVFSIAGHSVDLIAVQLPSSVDLVHAVPREFRDYSANRAAGAGLDVTVVVGDERIEAHEVILSSRSTYFFDRFNAVEPPFEDVFISEFDADTIRSLIDYAYTGKITVHEGTAQHVMAAASHLGMDSIVDECAQFMRKRITVANVLPFHTLCRSIGYDKVDAIVSSFIGKNFVSISHSPDFLNLPFDVLEGILQRDSLYVEDEQQVFDAATRWIGDDDAHAQREYGARLLRAVRFTLLPVNFITDVVERTPWVVGNAECMAMIAEAKVNISTNHSNSAPRVCENAHKLVFVVGHLPIQHKGPTDSPMAFYEPITNKWTICKSLPTIRGRHGVALVDNKIYAIGGNNNGNERLSTCDIFDMEENEWIKDVPESWKLSSGRAAMATGVINGEIIIAGGYNGEHALNTVQTINPSDDAPEWRNLAPMSKARSGAGSCVFNGKLYVFGGHDVQQINNCGECYDPVTNTWTEIAPMISKRCRFGVAALKGHIYAVGGLGGNFLKEVERYDPTTDSWTALRNMKQIRSRASVAVACGKLYVFGGFDGLDNVSTVEMYDPETDTWIKRADMPVHVGGVALCTLPIPARFATPVANLEIEDIEEMEEIEAKQAIAKMN